MADEKTQREEQNDKMLTTIYIMMNLTTTIYLTGHVWAYITLSPFLSNFTILLNCK